MICSSIIFFGNVANKFNDVFSFLNEVVIFPEYGDLFRHGKTNVNALQSFLGFLYEGNELGGSL